jgi:small conductance mechanosensitive channel
MKVIKMFLGSFTWESIIETGLRVFVILVVAWVLMRLLHRVLKQLEKRLINKGEEVGDPPSESQKRIETIVRLLRQAALLALWTTAGLMILKEMGVEIGPIIASAGIVGVAVGFGAQNLVRDIIAGFFIILENQIRVGDVATINGTGGLVEKINFRTTVLRDLSGVVHIFPNGAITSLSNLTKEWSGYVFEIGVAYKENTDQVVEIMREVGHSLRDDEKFGRSILEDIEIFGVDKLGDSAVIIKGRIKTKPIRQWEVGREYLRRVKYAFDEKKIEIPFPHRTVYFGENSKPFALHMLEKQMRRDPRVETPL